jgi:hypothetical protein
MSSYAILLMILVGLVGIWGTLKLNSELKTFHPSEWQHLGCPTLFSSNSMYDEFRWIRFILFRKYARLGNRRISMLGDVILCCGLVNAAIVIAWAFMPHGLAPAI